MCFLYFFIQLVKKIERKEMNIQSNLRNASARRRAKNKLFSLFPKLSSIFQFPSFSEITFRWQVPNVNTVNHEIQ